MDINDVLNTLLNSANADKTLLDALLAQLQGETLFPDDDSLYPPPVMNEDGTWTLTQGTANSGVFEGVYRLADASACAFLEIVSIVAYDEPSTGAPAQLRACASDLDPSPSMDDLVNISALDGVNFSGFVIRSSIAYEIQVRITACIDGQCGDAVVEFVSATSSVTEGTSTHQVTVRLSLTGGETSDDITVDVGYGGTASNPADYTTSTTSVTFLTGSVDGAEQNITLTIVDDAVVESDESIVLTLSNPRGQDVELGEQASHAVTLSDNDWTHMFDFTTGQHGWSVGADGTYTSGVGFTYTNRDEHSGVQLSINLTSTQLVDWEMFYLTAGTASGYPRFMQATGSSTVSKNLPTGAGSQDQVLTIGFAVTTLAAQLYTPVHNSAVTISKCIVRGHGTEPFT